MQFNPTKSISLVFNGDPFTITPPFSFHPYAVMPTYDKPFIPIFILGENTHLI